MASPKPQGLSRCPRRAQTRWACRRASPAQAGKAVLDPRGRDGVVVVEVLGDVLRNSLESRENTPNSGMQWLFPRISMHFGDV